MARLGEEVSQRTTTNMVINTPLPLWLAVRLKAEQEGISISQFIRRALIHELGIEGISEAMPLPRRGGHRPGGGRKANINRLVKAGSEAKTAGIRCPGLNLNITRR